MKIRVLGVPGNVGSGVVTEAPSRGHEVTVVVRDLARFHTEIINSIQLKRNHHE